MLPQGSGTQLFYQASYLDQTDNWSGTSRAPAADNEDQHIRTLYQSVEIGQEIPPALYKAVATVLAFIMTLRKRGSVAGTHTVRTLAPAR